MDNKKLDLLRDSINSLDDKILDLLQERSEIVTKIGDQKKSRINVVDIEREQKVLDRLLHNSKAKYSKDSIVRIWRQIFQASTKLQQDNISAIDTKRSINSINIYKGGKSSVNSKENIIKLSSNENSYGPSPKVMEVIKKEEILLNTHRYPNIDGFKLRQKLASVNNLDPNRIVLGCGSDETLLFAALSFCQSGDEIIQAEHGFEMYSIIAKIVGAVSKYAKEENYKLSVESICDQLSPATKIIFIANPNNPSGSYLSKKEIRDLMNRIPSHIIVVLDGAYAEYVMESDYDKDFSLVKEFDNIILTRTFSKAYGLAGIRIGWCYSSSRVSSILNRVKGPFNTTAFSQKMAIVALQDQNHILAVIKETKKNKEWFELELSRLKIKFYPSFANFSFIELTKDMAIKTSEILLKNGIIVRQLDSYKLPHCLRITIGTMENMKKIISIIENLYE